MNIIELNADNDNSEYDLQADVPDDLSLLYAAINSDPEMAEMISELLPYIDRENTADALFFAAMGKKTELLALAKKQD